MNVPKSQTEILAIARQALALPPSERAAFVRASCGDDASACAMAEQLISQQESATLVGGSDDVASASSTTHPSIKPADPTSTLGSIGAYRILGVIGEGGMGMVYLAEQDKPRRVVALKVVRPGLVSPSLLKRFEHESEILAKLQHPGIAQIYEAGSAQTSEGAGGSGRPIPFFAMEYIRGVPLTSHVQSKSLSTNERIGLFLKVCDAVQHAHSKGVIHRDLKPGNILVTPEGDTKVLDFGIARAAGPDVVGATMQTEAGQIIGTIPYMSPEQIAGRGDELDTRSDVYALGVILYQLLAGKLPHDIEGKTIPDAIRTLESSDAPRLGSLSKVYRGDLETIVSKALEHDRDRRYQSASEFSADLIRYLNDEPILARPPSRTYQLKKFAQRNRGLVVGLAAAFVVLVTGIVATTWQAIEATRGREAADKARIVAETEKDNALAISKYLDTMFVSIDPDNAAGREVTVREVLDAAAQTVGESFKDKPRVESSIRSTLGSTYRVLGKLKEAETHAERAYKLCAQALGESDKATIDAKHRLAIVYIEQTRFDEAEKLMREVVASLEAMDGPEDANTGAAKADLARILGESGRLDESEKMLRESIRVCSAALGERNKDVLISMHNLGTLMKDQGRLEESEKYLQHVLDLRLEVYGPEHFQTSFTMNSLATCLQKQGKNEDAIRMYTEVLRIRRKVAGPEHPATTAAMANLAATLIASGKLAEAEPLAREAVEVDLRTLGESHTKTLVAMANLAYLLEDTNKLDDAEDLYRRVVRIRKTVAAGRDPDTWGAMNNLASLLQRRGKLDEAESTYAELLKLCAESPDPTHFYIAIFKNNYGELLTILKKYNEAEPQLVDSLPTLEKKFGPSHARVKKAKDRLIKLYEAWGKPDEATKYR